MFSSAQQQQQVNKNVIKMDDDSNTTNNKNSHPSGGMEMKLRPKPQAYNKDYFDYDVLIKTIMVGDSCVGKSSLLYRYAENDWNPHYLATIGVDFKTLTFERSGKIVKLQLWDTAGQERFRTITNTYYRGCHGVVLVFDYANRESFENCEKQWMGDVERFATQGCPVVLLGNKSDIPEASKEVTDDEAMQMAQRIGERLSSARGDSSSSSGEDDTTSAHDIFTGKLLGRSVSSNNVSGTSVSSHMKGSSSKHAIPFFNVSAKYDRNVEEAFTCVVETCVRRRLEVLEKKKDDVDEERRKRRLDLKKHPGDGKSDNKAPGTCYC